MGEVFKGWRRKLGVVTLVTACVLMGGSIRSRVIHDVLEVAEWDDGGVEIASYDGYLSLGWIFFVEPRPGFRIIMPHWSSLEIDTATVSNQDGVSFGGSIQYVHKVFAPNDDTAARILSIHYLLLISPLTLISVYLLLAKPRVAKPPKTIEPDPAEAPKPAETH